MYEPQESKESNGPARFCYSTLTVLGASIVDQFTSTIPSPGTQVTGCTTAVDGPYVWLAFGTRPEWVVEPLAVLPSVGPDGG